jgi:hypothetical protein
MKKIKVPSWIYGSPGAGKTEIVQHYADYTLEANVDDPGVFPEFTLFVPIAPIKLEPHDFSGHIAMSEPFINRLMSITRP